MYNVQIKPQFKKIIGTLLFYICFCSLLPAQKEYFISYLSVKDGLSQNEVTSIIRDKYGLMWFATRGGLNYYDGYNFKQFKPNHEQTNSLHSPSVEQIFSDVKGNIWIGTKADGISIYNNQKEDFSLPKDSIGKISKRIISYYQDFEGNIWAGSWHDGLFKLSEQGILQETFLENQYVKGIIQTPDSTIWCGTFGGLSFKRKNENFDTILLRKRCEPTEIIKDSRHPYLWIVGWNLELICFNYETFTYKRYNLPNKDHLDRPAAYSLIQDKNGDLWIGTWGNGLYKFNTKTNQFRKIFIKPKGISETNIDFDVILDIYEDPIGDIWIGTDGGGIVKISKKSLFNRLDALINSKVEQLHINAVYKDAEKRIWIGTKGGGLSKISNDHTIKQVEFETNSPLYNKQVLVAKAIFEDPYHNIWVSFRQGLYVVKQNNNESFTLISAADFFNSPDLNLPQKVHDILFKDNELWIATQQRGLFLYNKVNGEFILQRNFVAGNETNQLRTNRVTSLFLDNMEQLWLSSYAGLYLYQRKDSSFITLEKLLVDDNLPLSNILLCTFFGSDNKIWFGTPCSLNSLIKTENGKYKLKDYTRANGLPDDYINGILEDNNGNIWFSTNAGISRLNPSTDEIRNYDKNDGVGDFTFSESACFKASDGTLFFGGHSNLTFFNPEDIKEKDTRPDIVITDFKIFNEKVPISKDGILTKNINDQKKITLSHKESEFSIEFAVLDYKAPERNQYAYYLEGYNDSTVYIGSRRHVSFSNLRPGNYILHLKGTNSNGLWNANEHLIQIEVLPAPWKTWYAMLFYITLIVGLVVIISQVSIKQERLKSSIKEEKQKKEQVIELNEFKLKFFTDISHELRTPLTLIFAPINELLAKDLSQVTSSFVRRKMQVIQHNANRLFNLVNQLLEFRRIEAGKVKLEASKHNLATFLDDILVNYEELAKNEGITFKKQVKGKHWECFFDSDKIYTVFNNLLSNAFKYAGTPGEVSFLLSENQSDIKIEIINNGKGIPQRDLPHLFDRFYQTSNKQVVGSSGIGLSLVKNYVELHKGQIKVESEVDKNTTFTVILQKGDKHITNILENTPKSAIEKTVLHNQVETLTKTRSINTGVKGSKILVAEDNEELRAYLVDLLSTYFNVIESENGSEAYEKAIEHKPELIISDVMMPLMDGFELCKLIKENDLISHIPVILLTAKTTPQDQLFGTKKGADAYLTKPFDPELLLEKVNLLIATRKKLTQKFAKKIKLAPKDVEITPEENIFLKKVIKITEKHIADYDFSPEQMASEMAMSLSSFYRKIKKITEQTPGEFIRSIRIKRAAQLLAETNLSVSEITEQVGYLDIKNFRRNFKSSYGMTPMEFRKSKNSSRN